MPIKNLKNKIKIYKMTKLKTGILILVVGIVLLVGTTSLVSAWKYKETPSPSMGVGANAGASCGVSAGCQAGYSFGCGCSLGICIPLLFVGVAYV